MSRLKVNIRRFRLMAAGLARFRAWWGGIEVGWGEACLDGWVGPGMPLSGRWEYYWVNSEGDSGSGGVFLGLQDG